MFSVEDRQTPSLLFVGCAHNNLFHFHCEEKHIFKQRNPSSKKTKTQSLNFPINEHWKLLGKQTVVQNITLLYDT